MSKREFKLSKNRKITFGLNFKKVLQQKQIFLANYITFADLCFLEH